MARVDDIREKIVPRFLGRSRLLPNRHLKRIVFPLIVLALLCGAIISGWASIQDRFLFLAREAGFDISDQLISFDSTDSYARAFFVALLNTLRVALPGFAAAFVLGIFLCLLRIYGGRVCRSYVVAYVEIIRNTPAVLQLFFWYALLLKLPGPRDAFELFNVFFLSNRGVWMPSIEANSYSQMCFVITLAIISTLIALRYFPFLAKILEPLRVCLIWICAATLLIGIASLEFHAPTRTGFGFSGGWYARPEFAVLFFGLTVYTAAFVSEIVRSGIEAIPAGQWQAPKALGFSGWQTFSSIILPQALRISLPALTNQFISITKNTSLGIAIGYPELMSVSNLAITQTGRSLEVTFIFIFIYLSLCLGGAFVAQWIDPERRNAFR